MSVRSKKRRRGPWTPRPSAASRMRCSQCGREVTGQVVEGRKHVCCDNPQRFDGNAFDGTAGSGRYSPRGTWRAA